MTPGHEPVVRAGDLRPGLHLNMLGADGPGKAEAEPEVVPRPSSSATTGRRRATAASSPARSRPGSCTREQVTELGAGAHRLPSGRSAPDGVTLFDSTGLAIQDLALCLALLEAHRAGRVRADTVRL